MSLLHPNLDAFQLVARCQTVHGAARELNLTQTAVTQRLRSLESSLGTTLFIRSRKGMRLTTEGQGLLRYCQRANELEGEALAQIQPEGGSAEIRIKICGPTSIMRSRLIPGFREVFKAWPNLAFSFRIDDELRLDEELRSGRADLAVLPPEQVGRELESRLLKPEKYVLVGAPQWKGRSLREIIKTERIIDFDERDPMSHSYLRKFNLLSLARPERHFVNSTEAIQQMFKEGLGYGVLTEEFSRDLIDSRQILVLNGGRTLEHRMALAWYPRPEMPSYFSQLLQAIR